MRKTYTIVLFVLFAAWANAQVVTANDSVSIAGGKQRVFYNLATGAKTSVSDTDWHLAISVMPTPVPPAPGNPLQGVTIRMNEVGGVIVAVSPKDDASTFSNVTDTTGFSASWKKLHDSDTSIIFGALNANAKPTDGYDFGWGKYSFTDNSVHGDSVFIIQLPDGSVKKLLVVIQSYDTSYDIKYANIDNSNLQNIHIRKADFVGKSFAYLNMIDNSVKDKEPAANTWDLLFLKYAATDVLAGQYFPTAGVWTNPAGPTVAKAEKVDVQSNDYSSLTFSRQLNKIGWTWKIPPPPAYIMVDSLDYFIHTGSTYYKLIFTDYVGSTSTLYKFFKTEVGASGIDDVISQPFAIYPNPATNYTTVTTNATLATVRLMDINGCVLAETKTSGKPMQLNTTGLAAGVYLVSVIADNKVSTQKLIITH